MLREANPPLTGSSLPLQVDHKAPATRFNNLSNVKGCLILLQAQDGYLSGQSQDSTLRLQSSSQYEQGLFVNYLSALARFFGLNARQDQSYLYLRKSDFDNLTSLPLNTSESLFVTLMLRIMLYESSPSGSKIHIQVLSLEYLSMNNIKIFQVVLILNFYINVIYDVFEIQKSAIRPRDFES